MTDPDVLRLGVLGCGMIGCTYAEQARTIPRLTVTSACSLSLVSRQRMTNLWPGAREYRDRDDLLADPEVDAILVCTPHRSHALDAVAALEAGKHVLIEKPIAASIDDLDTLEAMASRHPELVVLALPLTDTPSLSALRARCTDSMIGKIMEFSSTLDVPGPPRSNWYYSQDAGGGPTLDTLPYALGRLLALTGFGLAKALTLVSQVLTHRRCADGGLVEQEVEDNVTLLLSFHSGQQAIVKSSWCISRPEDYLLVRGRQGDLRLDCWRGTLLMRTEKPPPFPHSVTEWDGEPAYSATLPDENSERAKLIAFRDLIRLRGTTLPETAFTMRLIIGALAVRHGTVPIPRPPGSQITPRLPGMVVGTGYL